MKPELREKIQVFLNLKGLRRTKQRDIIIETIFGTTDHFTADHLWDRVRKQDQNASRATVYRTLSLLVESGLLRQIDLGRDQTWYDPNFNDHPHHNHLICKDCDFVVEFEDMHIDLLEECISRRLGFTPETKSIRIEATCQELRRNGSCSKQERQKAVV